MGFIVEIIQNISAFVGQKVSTISTAISGIGEFFGGDFFTDLLAFFAVPFVLAKSFVLTVFSVIQKTTVDAFNSLGNFWEIIKNSLVDFGASISLVFQLIKNNVADLFAGLVVSLANSITAGELFVEALAKNISDFGALVFSVVKDSLTGFPYAVSATVIAGLLLAVVLLMLTEKILVVFDALDLMVIKKNVKQFFGKTIIKQRAEKQATPIVMPNVQPISFAQAFVVVSFLAFLAYSLPQKYQLASLSPWLQRSEGINSDAGETSQDGGYQGNMNLTPTEILGETTQETLSLLAESNPNLYQLLNAGVQRRSNATSLQLGMITINPQGQIFLLPKSISSREIKNYVIKNIDIADHAITSRTIKNHTIRSIDLKRELTIEELKIDHNLTVRGNLITEGTLIAVDMNLSGNLDLQDNLMLNIGNQNTDFTASGGLNLAGNLNINNNFLANATTGNITAGTYNGNTITNGTGTLTLNEHTLTLTNNTQLNQNLLTTSTPQFARLGLGVPADATNILTATSSSTTDLSKTLNISHTGIITGTGYAGYFSKTGASTTNVGLYTIATGATNNYALQVDSAVVGATNYTIYANGVAKNYFAGNIGIGDAAPGTNLSVIGNAQIGYASGTTVSAGTSLAISSNVGIGTTGPGAKLEVYGGMAYFTGLDSVNANGNGLGIFGGNDTGGIYMRGDNSGTNNLSLGTNIGDISFKTGSGAGTDRMIIQNGGNVGIGTTSPLANLHILGGASSNASMRMESGSGRYAGFQMYDGNIGNSWAVGHEFAATSNASLVFSYGNVGSESVVAKVSSTGGFTQIGSGVNSFVGNVGIGTTGPGYKLDVVGTSGNASVLRVSGDLYPEIALKYTNNAVDNLSALRFYDEANNWKWMIANYSDAYSTASMQNLFAIYQRTNSGDTNVNAYRLVIDNTGNVGIGTTSPGAKLDINDNSGGAEIPFKLRVSDNANDYWQISNATGGAGLFIPTFKTKVDTASYTGGLGGDGTGTSGSTFVAAVNDVAYSSGYYAGAAMAFEARNYAETGALSNRNLFSWTNWYANSPLMVINPSGNIGMGYSNPGTAKLAINGNVGIGTTSPGGKVVIAGGESNTALLGAVAGNTSNALINLARSSDGIVFHGLRLDASDNLHFDYRKSSDGSPQTAMTIDRISGNVGIGTTGPGAKFQIYTGDGTSGLRTSLICSNSTTSKLYTDANGNMICGTDQTGSGTGNLVDTLSATLGAGNDAGGLGMINLGNVGIGTTSPIAKLHSVVADGVSFAIGLSGTTKGLRVEADSTSMIIRGVDTTLTGSYQPLRFGGSDLRFETNGTTEAMRILSNGNVGIGTTSPNTALHVHSANGVVDSFGNLMVSTNDAVAINKGGYLTFGGSWDAGGGSSTFGGIGGRKENVTSGDATGYLMFSTSNSGSTLTEKMRITSSGNVGIGTTGPGAKLEVAGAGSANTIKLKDTTNPYTTLFMGAQQFVTNRSPIDGVFEDVNKAAASVILISGVGNSAVTFNTHTSNNTNPLERMRINGDGNVGIGTPSPLAKLHVVGNYDNDGTGGILLDALSGSPDIYSLRINPFVVGSQKVGYQFQTKSVSGGTNVPLTFDNSGNVGIGTTSPGEKLSILTGALELKSSAFNTSNNRIYFTRHQVGSTYGGIDWRDSAGTVLYQVASGVLVGNGIEFNEGDGVNNRMYIQPGGNVGIGTTGPSSRLHVQSVSGSTENTRFANNDFVIGSVGTELKVSFGAASGNTYAILNALNSGETAWTNLALQTGGGNVGIGTTGPGTKLHIYGTTAATVQTIEGVGGGVSAGLVIKADTTGQAGIQLYENSTQKWNIYKTADANGDLRFYSLGALADVLTIKEASGNVGIGTTGPLNLLHLKKGTNLNLILGNQNVQSGATAMSIVAIDDGYTTNIPLEFHASKFYFHSGNVGIGTTTPNIGLEVVKDNGNGWTALFRSAASSEGVFLGTRYTHATVQGISGDLGSLTDLLINPLGGNVGIGTAGPTSKLHIYGADDPTNGQLRIESSGADARIELDNSSANRYSLNFSASAGYEGLRFMYNNSDKVIFDENGNLGIGTTSPGSALDVNGSINIPSTGDYKMNNIVRIAGGGTFYSAVGTAAAPSYAFGADVDTGLFLTASGSNAIGFSTGGTEAMRITSGNVGIGTTTPGATLDVNGRIFGANGTAALPSISSRGENNAGLFFGDDGVGSYLGFSAAGSEGIRLNRFGNVGIGTTAPGSLFTVAGTIRSDTSGTPEVYLNKSGTRGWSIRNDGAFNIYNWETATNQLTVLNSGNVGIGTTTPQTKLDVAGTIRATAYSTPTSGTGVEILYGAQAANTGNIIAYDRTASAYKPLTLDGSTILLNAYNTSGNVGIGTTSPGAKLDVRSGTNATLNYPTGDWAAKVFMQTDASTSGGLVVGNRWQDNTSTIFEAGSLYGSGSAWASMFVIKGQGNVGIGTTSPGATLDVNGTSIIRNNTIWKAGAGNNTNLISYSGTDDGIFRQYSGGIIKNQLFAAGDSYFNSGNVGIGIAGPQEKLTVAGNQLFALAPDVGSYGKLEAAYGGNIATYGVAANIDFYRPVAGSGNEGEIRFSTNPGGGGVGSLTQRMVIDKSGNVGIGTTGPTNLVEIQGNTTGTGGTGSVLYVKQNASWTANEPYSLNVSGYSNLNGFRISGPGVRSLYSGASGSQIEFATHFGFISFAGGSQGTDRYMTIQNGGNVGIGTTAPGYKLQVYTGTANGYVNSDGTWGSSSDLNLKKNISSVSSVLNNVLALNPVLYNFKTERNGTTPHIGFVAQEVEKLFPELVSTGPDGIKGISYAMFTPLLTKAIQQQQTQITGIADNQNKIVEQLTNQLSYQLADKTISIDTKINLIGASLDELNQEQYDQQIKRIKGQIEDNTGNLTLLDARLKLLETVLTLDSNNLKVIGDISANNLTLSGKLDVDSAVAGAFAVKVSADKPKTIGEAYICPAGFAGDACDTSDASSDGKSILVQTSAVSASAKIFVTPENDTNGSVWVEKKSDNSGFKIMLKPLTPILEKIKINWWIVEKISD
ncbi:MAG: tail fiber domain-containing protein [Candidatus Moraniibacteriota bacterium]